MNLITSKHILTDTNYRQFTDLVREKSGIEIPKNRWPDLEKAVLQVMNECFIENPKALLESISNEVDGSSVLDSLISQITVGETYFFRNLSQFSALEKNILPNLIKKRKNIKQLRIWSAGCASGEEPFSVAILLKRLLKDISDWNVFILATDINQESLKKAQKGVFGSWSFREEPFESLSGSFIKEGKRFRLKQEIQNMVTFSYHNLIEDNYPSIINNTHMMDLILCRNVFIYFSENVGRIVAKRLHASLTEGGWLVVGPAEVSRSDFSRFSVQNFPDAVIFQKLKNKERFLQKTSIESGKTKRILWEKFPEERIKKTVISKQQSVIKIPKETKASLRPPAPIERKLQEVPPTSVQSLIELYKAGQILEAIEKLLEFAKTNTDDFWAPYWIARMYADRLQYTDAEYWTGIAINREPLFAPAHYLHSLILQGLGRTDESLESIRRCLYIDPEFLLGHFFMAGLLKQLSKPQRALKVLENLKTLIADKHIDDLVPEGDGLTIGRFSRLIAAQEELLNNE